MASSIATYGKAHTAVPQRPTRQPGQSLALGVPANLRRRRSAHQHICELGKQGFRPFFVGALGETAIAFLTLGLAFGADRLPR
jgi:hypothetical protein